MVRLTSCRRRQGQGRTGERRLQSAARRNTGGELTPRRAGGSGLASQSRRSSDVQEGYTSGDGAASTPRESARVSGARPADDHHWTLQTSRNVDGEVHRAQYSTPELDANLPPFCAGAGRRAPLTSCLLLSSAPVFEQFCYHVVAKGYWRPACQEGPRPSSGRGVRDRGEQKGAGRGKGMAQHSTGEHTGTSPAYDSKESKGWEGRGGPAGLQRGGWRCRAAHTAAARPGQHARTGWRRASQPRTGRQKSRSGR